MVTDVIDVHVPAGATGGTFEVPYQANDIDSPPERNVYLQAFAVDDLVIGGHAMSQVLVRDDDPDARLQVTRAARSVPPGEPMVWQARLDRPTDYAVFVPADGIVTDPRAGNLRVSDVPAKWARRHLGRGLPPSMPVARRLFDFMVLPAGAQLATLAGAHPPRTHRFPGRARSR